MGLSSIEERNTQSYCLSPKIYQAPDSGMDGGPLESPRKKKMFSSSSFYEEPNCIYPTVQEQVQLCRQIAESLSDDCNLKSKGTNMFFKRVKKAEKWIVAQSAAAGDDSSAADDKESSSADPSRMPYVRPKKGHALKLILDPRQIVDMRRLLEEGVDIVEHNAVSPEICHNLVRDLNAATGCKGALLFARRKKKSEEWVVDENKVRHLLQGRGGEEEPPPLVHPRVKALSEVDCQSVADSVIRAAEAKVMTYPKPQVPVIQSFLLLDDDSPASSFAAAAQHHGPPRGWAPATPVVPAAKLEAASSPLSRSLSFTNFNSSPRAWNASASAPASVRPVRPPSFLLVQ